MTTSVERNSNVSVAPSGMEISDEIAMLVEKFNNFTRLKK
jgi:hypothetical protein